MANDVFQMIIGGHLAGQPVENVLHWEGPDEGNSPILRAQSLNNAWVGGIEPAWLNVHPDNYTYLGTKVKQVNNGGGPTVGRLAAPATMGNRPSASDTSAVGPVLLAPVDVGPKWVTGKIFISGVGEDDIADNVFIAALLVACAALNGLLVLGIDDGPGGNHFNYGVWKRPITGPPAVPGAFFDATAMGVSTKPGLQNRRLQPHF